MATVVLLVVIQRKPFCFSLSKLNGFCVFFPLGESMRLKNCSADEVAKLWDVKIRQHLSIDYYCSHYGAYFCYLSSA